MIRVQVQDAGVQSLLRRLQAAMGNMQPAMDEIGSTLNDRIRLGFKASTDPWGNRWKSIGQAAIMGRLAHRTDSFGKKGKISAKGKGYLMGGIKPLLDTGALRNSITHNATTHSVEVGTNIKYAKTHQFGANQGAFGRTRRGGPIPWGNIPARPFLPIRNDRADLPPAWLADVVGIIQSRIAQAAR